MKMQIQTKILAIVCVALCSIALANEPKKRGSHAQIAIQSTGLWHSSANASTSGLHEALFASYDYTTKLGLGFGIDALFGASYGNLDNYMIQGMQDLMSVRPVGDINFLVGLDVYVGWHLIRRSYDKPLYLGTGLKELIYSNVVVNTSFNMPLMAIYMPIELRGDVRLSPALAIEYLLAYDIALDQATQVTISEKDKRMLPIDSSYGLRLQFGGRYYASPKLYFFGTLVAEYYNFGASKGIFVGNPPDTQEPGVKPGAEAVLSYPRSNLGYVGIRLGIGY
ncbi:hypothetical protein [Helicobacter canis]|uniref:Outer membrane protein beta-barrel domain-containing protein n=1 Tax=Helicobacter canis TaxID=29419 RepID=A0A377J1U4_9HELI|nr:hypothetical protein [Helicobacter canis]STO96338.1 Uncharacterised protein [Helicobacter canis]